MERTPHTHSANAARPTPPTAGRRYRATGLGAVLRERGVTKAWVARTAGVTRSHVVHLVAGRRTFDEAKATAVADALGLPLFLLFGFADANDTFATQAGRTGSDGP